MRPEYLLLSNGLKTKSDKIIANILNKHFTTVGEKLAEKLSQSNTDPLSLMGDKNPKSIFLEEIKLHEVLEEISTGMRFYRGSAKNRGFGLETIDNFVEINPIFIKNV